MSSLPLALLPGLLCDGRLWRHQIAALADMTIPVVGDLTRHDDIDAMARHVLDRMPPGRFALAGLSMGGYVSLAIMRLAPERVAGLALIDTSARDDTPEQAAHRRTMMRATSLGRFMGVSPRLLPTLIHPGKVADPEVGGLVMTMAKDLGRDVFLRQQSAIIARPDSRPMLGSIRVPTLVAVGDGDQVTPPDRAQEMAASIPTAELEVIPECGHLPAIEVPDRLSAAMRRWLERIAAG